MMRPGPVLDNFTTCPSFFLFIHRYSRFLYRKIQRKSTLGFRLQIFLPISARESYTYIQMMTSRLTPAPLRKPPPLLALPLHLKQRIFAYLDEAHNLSLLFLRRTHPILRQSIPYGYSSDRQTKKCQLWTAEREHFDLLPAGSLPCYCCLEVYRIRCFERKYRYEEEELNRRCEFCTRVWDRGLSSFRRLDGFRGRARL